MFKTINREDDIRSPIRSRRENTSLRDIAFLRRQSPHLEHALPHIDSNRTASTMLGDLDDLHSGTAAKVNDDFSRHPTPNLGTERHFKFAPLSVAAAAASALSRSIRLEEA